MSVHEQISNHSRNQHEHLNRFLELDAAREEAISEAVEACRLGIEFTVNRINSITASINAHAQKGLSPTRLFVTPDMIREYVRNVSGSVVE